jgi:hypothetical protein
MVVAELKALTAAITISQCGRIIGLDPDTIKARIHAGKFPMKALIIIGQDTRIDPALLADEIEGSQKEGSPVWWGPLTWKRVGTGIDGFDATGVERSGWIDTRTPDRLVDFVQHMSQKNWVTKRDLVDIVRVWADNYGGGQ